MSEVIIREVLEFKTKNHEILKFGSSHPHLRKKNTVLEKDVSCMKGIQKKITKNAIKSTWKPISHTKKYTQNFYNINKYVDIKIKEQTCHKVHKGC